MEQQLPISELTERETTMDLSNLNPFELRVVLSEAYKCIRKASSFGGRVFGGFVRDVIVPSTWKSKEVPKLKDIDIWFKTDEEADTFRELMGKSLSKKCSSTSSLGDFTRYTCYLKKYNVNLLMLDVIVAEKLPVNDFDVNTVTYALTIDHRWVTTCSSLLFEQIMNKKATMLRPYFDRIEEAKEAGNTTYYEERIQRIFLSKGWEVLVPTPLTNDFFSEKPKIPEGDFISKAILDKTVLRVIEDGELVLEPPQQFIERAAMNNFIVQMHEDGELAILNQLRGLTLGEQQEIYWVHHDFITSHKSS